MKKQKIAFINDAELQELNKHGWFVKQVVERRHPVTGGCLSGYWVLLEKETTPGEEDKEYKTVQEYIDFCKENGGDCDRCPLWKLKDCPWIDS